MKSYRSKQGFTLVELLVVIAIIAILAAISIGGYTFAQRNAARQKTIALKTLIQNGLEKYKEVYAEYPEPADPASSPTSLGPAKMLYQALSGDGADAIKGVTSGGSSDGQFSTDELKAPKIMDVDKAMFKKAGNEYYLVDGFGEPFMYKKALTAAPGQPQPTLETKNATYDLWSWGGTDEKSSAMSGAGWKNVTNDNVKWIKNW